MTLALHYNRSASNMCSELVEKGITDKDYEPIFEEERLKREAINRLDSPSPSIQERLSKLDTNKLDKLLTLLELIDTTKSSPSD